MDPAESLKLFNAATKRAIELSPPPKYAPGLAGILGVITVVFGGSLFLGLAGIHENHQVQIAEFIMAALGFLVPFVIARDQQRRHDEVLKEELDRLHAESRAAK